MGVRADVHQPTAVFPVLAFPPLTALLWTVDGCPLSRSWCVPSRARLPIATRTFVVCSIGHDPIAYVSAKAVDVHRYLRGGFALRRTCEFRAHLLCFSGSQ